MGQEKRSKNAPGQEKRSGLHMSVTDDERARFNRLLDYEKRSGSQQLIHMMDRRLAEIDRLERKNG